MVFAGKIALFMEFLQLLAIGVFRSCLRARERGIVKAGDVLLLLALPIVGMFGHNKLVFYAFLFVMPLLWIGDVGKLARRYVLFLVMYPELAEALVSGNVYYGTISSVTFFNAGSLLALSLTRRPARKSASYIDFVIWLMFLASLFMFTRGVPIGGTVRSVILTFLLVMPPFYIISRGVTSPRGARDVAIFIVLGGLCNAVVGIYGGITHWALYESFYQALNVPLMGLTSNLSIRAGLLRAGGAVGNYEVLGLVTGLSLIAAIATKERFTRGGWWVIMGLIATGCFLSQARSAWLATAVGLALYAAYEGKWNRLIAGGSLAIVASVSLLLVSPSDGRFGQLLGKSGHSQVTTEYRQDLLTRGMEEAIRHPLTGQTLDQLDVSMNDLRQGEHIIDFVNTHLLAMLVGGIGILVAWLFAWATPLVLGWKIRRRAGGREGAPIAFCFASLGTCFVFLAFTSPVDRILSIVAISMGLMSASIRLVRTGAVGTRRQEGAVVDVPGRPPIGVQAPVWLTGR